MQKKKLKQKKYKIRLYNKFAYFAKRKSARRRNNKLIHKSKRYRKKQEPTPFQIIKRRRKDFWKQTSEIFEFNDKRKVENVEGEVGIETGEIDKFIKIGSNIIDSNASDLYINLLNCTRLWPSAITLLCSFDQWRNLLYNIRAKRHINTKKPRIASNQPQSEGLENYLMHCGFYNYINIDKKRNYTNSYDNSEVVRIEREKDNDNIESRCKQVMDLIKRKSALSNEEIEKIQCKVVPEIIYNVFEHGQNYNDNGWWLLAQYHKKHGIISICIADNGMGFRESLLTGPQREDIIERTKGFEDKDGYFIELAFKEQVSGAVDANIREKTFFSTGLPRGSNRGNGLKRIYKTCTECSIPLSVFSQRGYVIFDKDGNIIKQNSFERRIFGGTMYNLIIPAKQEEELNGNN